MNERQFNYSRIPIFQGNGFTGKGVKIAIWEVGDLQHAANVADVVKQIAPNAEIFRYYGTNTDKIIQDILDKGTHLINMSLIGYDLKTSKHYNVLVLRSFIVASSGNSGVEEDLYPASHDECLAVGAVNYVTNTDIRKASYSTMSKKLDIVNFSDLEVSTEKEHVKGTSFSAPYTTAMLALYHEAFKKRNGRFPGIYETNQYVYANCKDTDITGGNPGFDVNTGRGIFTLNEALNDPMIWDSKKEVYIKKTDWIKIAERNNKTRQKEGQNIDKAR